MKGILWVLSNYWALKRENAKRDALLANTESKQSKAECGSAAKSVAGLPSRHLVARPSQLAAAD